jgi:hypothetical protein
MGMWLITLCLLLHSHLLLVLQLACKLALGKTRMWNILGVEYFTTIDGQTYHKHGNWPSLAKWGTSKESFFNKSSNPIRSTMSVLLEWKEWICEKVRHKQR